MTTTYTPSWRLPVPQPLDPATIGQWGPLVDAMATLADQGGAGNVTVPVTVSPQTLTTANGASDQARPLVRTYTGTLSGNTTINAPNVPQVGWSINLTTGNFSIVESAGAGTDATIPPDGYYWLRVSDGATNALVPNVGVGALKTQGNATVGGILTISGGAPGQATQIPNNANYGQLDAGGTLRGVLGLGSDNNLYITNAGGQSTKWRNQALTFTRMSLNDGGSLSLGGNTGDLSTVSITPAANGVTVSSVPSPGIPFTCFVGNIATTSSFYGFWEFGGTNVGSIAPNAGGVSYNTTSDARLKLDDGPMDDVGRFIDRLKPRWFRWKSAPNADPEPGFFAQQVYRVFPWAVTKGRNRGKKFIPWQMDNAKLVPLLVAELQSLRRRMREMERKCLSSRGD